MTGSESILLIGSKLYSYSENKSIKCGVPPGSALGLLLFLLFINDIHTCSNLLSFILFADNTNLFISGN